MYKRFVSDGHSPNNTTPLSHKREIKKKVFPNSYMYKGLSSAVLVILHLFKKASGILPSPSFSPIPFIKCRI